MDATELSKHRDAQMGTPTTAKDGSKTENVIKMFTDPAKIAALKANVVIVKIGNPQTDVVIRPLNPKTGVEAYKLLRTTLMPIVTLYRRQQEGGVNIVDVMDAFGENVESITRLIFLILQRGNPHLTQEWVDENLDLVPDLLTIIPPFMEQNMFDTLFSPKAPAPQALPQEPSESASLAESSQPLKAL